MSAITDPSTGGLVHVRPYRFAVTLLDDAAFYGLCVYVYDWTGVNRWFLPMAEVLASDPLMLQALRYGLMFASMNELRRWLESMAVSTDASTYIENMMAWFTS